jgi:hypothetical protein
MKKLLITPILVISSVLLLTTTSFATENAEADLFNAFSHYLNKPTEESPIFPNPKNGNTEGVEFIPEHEEENSINNLAINPAEENSDENPPELENFASAFEEFFDNNLAETAEIETATEEDLQAQFGLSRKNKTNNLEEVVTNIQNNEYKDFKTSGPKPLAKTGSYDLSFYLVLLMLVSFVFSKTKLLINLKKNKYLKN